MSDASERVQRGSELLDREVGDEWYLRIDLDNLSISQCKACILGQLYGHYFDGKSELFGNNIEAIRQAERHGFHCVNGDDLTEEWKREIERRREEQRELLPA